MVGKKATRGKMMPPVTFNISMPNVRADYIPRTKWKLSGTVNVPRKPAKKGYEVVMRSLGNKRGVMR